MSKQFKINKDLLNWLLQSDPSVQYQVHRDLLNDDRPDLQKRILKEGWGAKFLSLRSPEGHWGRAYYQPKWTSTHYTLLDIKHLNPSADNKLIKQSIDDILMNKKGIDGGINPAGTVKESDVCLNGMVLEFASYFKSDEKNLISIIDFILSQQLNDGGFNCRYNRSGAVHSSLHSSLSVCEGINEYIANGYNYRKTELQSAEQKAREFILIHQLFLSDRTGKIIRPEFTRLSYPYRWRYNIIKALDYFRNAAHKFDSRMKPAIDVLIKKRQADGKWKLQAKHPGQTHFEMEKTAEPSRWNTLRALRILKQYHHENN